MGHLRATNFVGADNLRLIAQPNLLMMIGDIGCLGNILITVEKYLAVVTEKSSPGTSSMVTTTRWSKRSLMPITLGCGAAG